MANAEPKILSYDDLLYPFVTACKPRSDWRVGVEAEKFGVYVRDGSPIPFEGDKGVHFILDQLSRRYGWQTESEVPGGPGIAIRREEASVTLEPGGQVELSGSPQETIHGICAEFRNHMKELHSVADPIGITWLGIGFHPFAKREELPWVPKLRYGVMREYMPTRGSMALDMMQRTCTVQANYDFESEQDAVDKLRVSLALQPIATAMFANSPLVENQLTGERSHRAKVWLNMDPDRSGLLPFVWDADASFKRYIEWALDVPMFLIKRDGKAIPNTKQTFRQFMREDCQGYHATMDDWEMHLNTLFPEVRLKNTLEVRGADGQATALTCALPALWKGLLYEPSAFNQAKSLASQLNYDEIENARPSIAKNALTAVVKGKRVRTWAERMLEISWNGLRILNALNTNDEDETIHLSRLKKLVEKGQCPADALIAAIQNSSNVSETVIRETYIQ